MNDDAAGLDPELQHWQGYVAGFARALTGAIEGAAALPGEASVTAAGHAPVLLLSPHPDDETITGLLPLRLLRESGVPVVNLALTFGSDPARQQARKHELVAACRVTGFASQAVLEPLGFSCLRPLPEIAEAQWRRQVAVLVERFCGIRPALVGHPHVADRHPAHVAAARLAIAALSQYSRQEKTSVLAVATECWHPLAAPNLLVGADNRTVARLCLALSRHAGEVARNPYHRRQPVRMIDTVFRGAELVGGFGSGAPAFVFGELYRLCRYVDGRCEEPAASLVLPPDQPLSLAALKGVFAAG